MASSYFAWSVAVALLILAAKSWFSVSALRSFIFRKENPSFVALTKLEQVREVIRDLKSRLEVGLSLPENWGSAVQSLPTPWGGVLFECVDQLRKRGASIIPVFDRFKGLIELSHQTLAEAHALAAPARAQIWICFLLVPITGAGLYALLDVISADSALWFCVVLFSMSWSVLGAYFLSREIDLIFSVGLNASQKDWPIWLMAGAEKLMSQIKAGEPADRGWNQTLETLAQHSSLLADFWGPFRFETRHSYETDEFKSLPFWVSDFREQLLISIRASLFDGRPCLDRIGASIQAFQINWSSELKKGLSTLPTRAIKPLFLFVLPSVLSLLVVAMALVMKEST